MRYTQNVEAELIAILIATTFVLMVGAGSCWAVITMIGWAIRG